MTLNGGQAWGGSFDINFSVCDVSFPISLNSFLQDAILVNIARGHLLDYDAVKSALETGRLAGLGMDVAWSEPFDPSDPVARHPNVILTPHLAGVSDKSYRTMAEVSCC
jgi:phosphoglycerate dehydrogenase-like enzyme